MNHQRIKNVLALCLVLCLILGNVPVATAAPSSGNGDIVPYMLYIYDKKCTLTISGEKAKIDAWVQGFPGEATECEIKATLQYKMASGFWSDVRSWTAQQDGQRVSVSATAAVTPGTTYRAKATVTVWAGNKSETVTVYSDDITV